MTEPFDRRQLLVRGGLLGLGMAASPLLRAAEQCLGTPVQTEGPFFPVAEHPDLDLDLTRVTGHAQRAQGRVVLVRGQVRDLDCAPLPGAVIEVWQACASGRYDHPLDDNPAPLDPDFQYTGRITADAGGQYRFRTIKPGAYPIGPSLRRPPHIHFKVMAAGRGTLVTQMYFEGEPWNARDGILGSLSRDEQRRLIVPFEPGADDAIEGRFDIVLAGHRTAEGTPRLDS
jgi:protocatechuate 3,4-dioxygenase, beta subunit